MRNDHLCVTLSAESTRLEEGLEVEDASLIHVKAWQTVNITLLSKRIVPLTSFHVVKSVRDTVNAVKERSIVDV